MGKSRRPLLAAFVFLLAALPFISTGIPDATAQQAPRYIALGDSLAAGVGASDPNDTGYVARVHEALESSDRFGGSGIDLINLSVPGATSSDLTQPGGQLANAIREIGRTEETPVITIDIGGNDLLALASLDSPCLRNLQTEPCQAELGETLSALQSNLSEVLTSLREAEPDASIVVVDLYNPFSGTGDIRELIADAGVQRINGVIGATASDPDLNVELASVFQHFQGRGNQWISDDRIHPNDDGHAVIAEVVLAALDGREPAISSELLSVPPDPVNVLGSASPSDGDGGVPMVVLVVGIAVAFVAGGAVSGAFFLMRGR